MRLPAAIIFALLAAVFLTANSFKMLQILQLSSYRNRGVAAWFKKSRYDYMARYFSYAFFSFTSMLVYALCFGGYVYVNLLGFLFFILFSAVFMLASAREKKKTPLRVTPRVVRLTVVAFILFAVLGFVAVYFTYDTPVLYAPLGWTPLFIPAVILLGNCLLAPLERFIAHRFEKAAAAKLRTVAPTVIGITGSYGKTTAKNILAAMLATQYKVLASPLSYNTPMGLCRVVNEELNDEDFFIAEMGARFKNDIEELVNLFNPDYGLLTSIGPQHLETFGSIENIVEAKFALSAAKQGLFLNIDSPLIAQNEAKYQCRKYYAGYDGSDAGYGGVGFSADGATFEIYLEGRTLPVKTCLLGDYVPALITLCALAASKLGISDENIIASITGLKPVEHRLQLIKSPYATVIDDAYNANPEGAACALRTLNMMDGVKVIVTPGLVEQGVKQEELNFELGKQIGEVCDYAVFIGTNAKALAAGVAEAGGRCEVKTAALLEDGMKLYAELKLDKPVVLFENDLPDNL